MHATIAGTRADELANRLKYAGVPVESMRIEIDARTALDVALDELPAGVPLVILAGYTPTLEFHQEMQRRGWVSRYWET